MANQTKDNPVVWLEMRQVYGDLANESEFATAFNHWLEMIWRDGVQATLVSYSDGA